MASGMVREVSRRKCASSVENCEAANKAVNPSGGSGWFGRQRFLAAAGLPWSFGDKKRLTLHFKQGNFDACNTI